MSLIISVKPTSAPQAFKAITMSRFSEVGYSQSDVNEIIKNFVFDLLNAFDKFPLYCFNTFYFNSAVLNNNFTRFSKKKFYYLKNSCDIVALNKPT